MTIVGGELDEIVDEFSDGRISYGCTSQPPFLRGYVGKTLTCAIVVRVEDPNTRLNKFVLIGWVRYV